MAAKPISGCEHLLEHEVHFWQGSGWILLTLLINSLAETVQGSDAEAADCPQGN